MNKLLRTLYVSVFVLFLSAAVITGSSPESRILKETAEPGQSINISQGRPVIVSKKRFLLVLMPESIFPGMKDPVDLTLVIDNQTEEPWSFSVKDLKAYSDKKDLEILEPEKIIAEAKKKYSPEEYKINQEQAKALAPYVEHKMQDLRDSLLKSGNIPPGGKVAGHIFIDVPPGTEILTIEVTAPGELHRFRFNVIEL